MAWYDYWLRDKGSIDGMPKVLLYVMGDNVWRSEEQWPLARTIATPYYLRAGGTLSGDEPQTGEPPDTYTYDPNPVPTLGGSNLLTNVGPYDQRPVESRDDVLCYTTDTLTENLEVTGPISAVLYAETDAVDTDFTVKFVMSIPTAGQSIFRMVSCAHCIAIIIRWYRHRSCPELSSAMISICGQHQLFSRRGTASASKSQAPTFPLQPQPEHRAPRAGRDSSGCRLPSIYHSSLYPSHILLPVIP